MRAEEIYRALTESPRSDTAWPAPERVALSMGAREGTKPEDDPLMGSQNAKARMGMVAAALRARGIEPALDATEDRELFRGLSDDALMEAAFACTDAADFRRRLGAQSVGGPPSGRR